MNMKPIVAVAIALTVGIVTFSGVLIPAIESGVDTKDTFTNEGYFRMAETEISEDDTITISWDYTKPTIISVGDTEYEIELNAGSSRTVAFCDNCLLRLFRHTSTTYSFEIWYAGVKSAYTTTPASATAIIDSEKVVWTTTDTETATNVTATGTWCIINNTGNYIMKDASTPAYMLKDSIFRIAGVSSIGTTGNSRSSSFFVSSGTVDDFTVTTPGVATVSNEDSTYTDVSGYVNLVSLEKITFTTTWTPNDEPIVNNQTYTYFAVPYEVTAEKSIHADASTILLFQTIPVFIVLGMIVAVVGVLYMKTRR